MKKYQFTEDEKKELEEAKKVSKKAFSSLSMKFRRKARKEGRFTDDGKETVNAKTSEVPSVSEESDAEPIEVHSDSVVISQEG